MPDENTQNPEKDKTFTIDQEALEAKPNTPAGSGAEGETETPATEKPTTEEPAEPATEAPTEPATEAPAEPATEAPAEPTTEAPAEPTPEKPENPEQKLDEHLTETTKPAPETQDTTKSSKKYLIIIIVAIALLAGGYFAYSYFFAGPGETNTLSPSDAMEELDEIIDELENVYAPPAEDEIEVFEEAILEEVDNSFPTLTEPADEPAEELTLEEPVLYEPLLGEPTSDEPAIDEPANLKVLR